MRGRIAGFPVWLVLLGVAGVGGLVWRQRKKSATVAQATQAQQQATTAQGTGGGQDPFLVAYQAGEASGVSTYSSGVSTGISLVDSILGMFPGGLEQKGIQGQTTPGGAGGGAAGGGGATAPGANGATLVLPPGGVATNPSAATIDPGAGPIPSFNYIPANNPAQPTNSSNPSSILSGSATMPSGSGWELVNGEWYNYQTGAAAPLTAA